MTVNQKKTATGVSVGALIIFMLGILFNVPTDSDLNRVEDQLLKTSYKFHNETRKLRKEMQKLRGEIEKLNYRLNGIGN